MIMMCLGLWGCDIRPVNSNTNNEHAGALSYSIINISININIKSLIQHAGAAQVDAAHAGSNAWRARSRRGPRRGINIDSTRRRGSIKESKF